MHIAWCQREVEARDAGFNAARQGKVTGQGENAADTCLCSHSKMAEGRRADGRRRERGLEINIRPFPVPGARRDVCDVIT